VTHISDKTGKPTIFALEFWCFRDWCNCIQI